MGPGGTPLAPPSSPTRGNPSHVNIHSTGTRKSSGSLLRPLLHQNPNLPLFLLGYARNNLYCASSHLSQGLVYVRGRVWGTVGGGVLPKVVSSTNDSSYHDAMVHKQQQLCLRETDAPRAPLVGSNLTQVNTAQLVHNTPMRVVCAYAVYAARVFMQKGGPLFVTLPQR